MVLPQYLIWFILGENQNKLVTQKKFIEHTNEKEWRSNINKLSKMKIVTKLKYVKLY